MVGVSLRIILIVVNSEKVINKVNKEYKKYEN